MSRHQARLPCRDFIVTNLKGKIELPQMQSYNVSDPDGVEKRISDKVCGMLYSVVLDTCNTHEVKKVGEDVLQKAKPYSRQLYKVKSEEGKLQKQTEKAKIEFEKQKQQADLVNKEREKLKQYENGINNCFPEKIRQEYEEWFPESRH